MLPFPARALGGGSAASHTIALEKHASFIRKMGSQISERSPEYIRGPLFLFQINCMPSRQPTLYYLHILPSIFFFTGREPPLASDV